MNDVPSGDYLTMMARQIVLQPRRFGVVGSYSREMMHAGVSEDMHAWAMNDLTLRLTTSVLSGRTISAHPKVEMTVPASWRQHLKHASNAWITVKHELWMGRDAEGETTTPPPWLILLWPLLVLWPKWLRKHPVKYAKMTATLDIDQDVLYPKIDMPASAGMPVIHESYSLSTTFGQAVTGTERWGTSLRQADDPSRFMSKYEIISAVRSDADIYGKYQGNEVWALCDWLEAHGVNVEQLVKRQGL
jgi:hypothetical protein